MSPTLSLLFGGLAATVSLAALAVLGALAASKKAEEQAARMAMPVRSHLRRNRRGSQAYRGLRN
jgi:hypothetical protein